MGQKIILDSDKRLILLYNKVKNIFEDKTLDIRAIFTAHYFSTFTGYDIYFKHTYDKFFYAANHVRILNFYRSLPLQDQLIFVTGELIDSIEIDEFHFVDGYQTIKYFRVITSSKSFLTNNLIFKQNTFEKLINYYTDLATHSESISKPDEPLYFLSKNYQKIKPSLYSVLYQYLEGRYLTSPDTINPIIVPFDFNQSQYKAINNAFHNSISVIEGPPGTGKTQTILNLISNIIVNNKNCAVISNNNSAIENIYDKLNEQGIAFISASLGKSDNVNSFFENQSDEELSRFLKLEINKVDDSTKRKIHELSSLVKKLHDIEIKKATLTNELNSILVEKKNHHIENNQISISPNLSSHDYLELVNRLELPKKIKFFERWRINSRYKIKLKTLNHNKLINKLEELFYDVKIREIRKTIDSYEKELVNNRKEKVTEDLKKLSNDYLLASIKERYIRSDRRIFNKDSYKNDYDNFLKRYPVVLSTSHSLLNNAPRGFLFDFLIIDEASQGDLLSSIVAMSCARNLVVVGDSRQLQQIDEVRLLEKSKEQAIKFNVPPAYQYDSNSILKSVREAVKEVPITLLREHYRCAPDIINFCNQMFYDGELIPMTTNHGTHIEIIKTITGHHARKNPNGTGQYNQREIDVLVDLLKDKELSKTGIITPFRYQARLIQERFNGLLEADTIHKFQGRQKDDIYLSFVVNSLEKSPDQIENRLYDFITNEKLLNVAISRAKNKVTAIVSEKIYESSNNIIHDFIKYTENLYGNSITKTSSVSSIFDYLYTEYDELLKKKFKRNSKDYKTELLMCELIDDVLKDYKRIGYIMHFRLSKLIKKLDTLTEEEQKYVLHPWTHVDFVFYNKISKERLFILEVDGIKFHEQNINQSSHDEIKDRVLINNGLEVHRFKTNESNEKSRLIEILNKFKY